MAMVCWGSAGRTMKMRAVWHQFGESGEEISNRKPASTDDSYYVDVNIIRADRPAADSALSKLRVSIAVHLDTQGNSASR
jgi:hypothetical protein